MDIQNIFLFFTASINFILAFLIYFRSKKKSCQISYSFFSFFIGTWALVLALFRYTADLDIALLLIKFSYIAAVGIAVSFFYFILNFPVKNKLSIKNKFLIFMSMLIILFFIWKPNFLIKEVFLTSYGKDVITNYLGHLLFALYFISFFFGAICISLYKYKHATGTLKSQLRYIFFGIAIPGVFGSLFNLIIPYFFKTHRFVGIGPIFTLIMIISITYAITQHQLMDIRIAIRKSAVYLMMAFFAYSFFYLSLWMLVKLFGNPYNAMAYVFGFLIALFFIGLLVNFEKFTNYLANKYFFGALYFQHESIKKIAEKLTTVIDADKLANILINALSDTLKVRKIAFISIDQEDLKVEKVKGFKKSQVRNLASDNSTAIKLLSEKGKILMAEELVVAKYHLLKENMEKMSAYLLIPLVFKDNIKGIMVLGNKEDREAFSKEDTQLLKNFSSQAALALENAMVYDNLENFNKLLSEKVEEKTKSIKEKNIKLRKLLQMKTEFLRVASHQLRTPISAIKGLVSMMGEDFEGLAPMERKNMLSGIFIKTQNMSNIINDILSAAELDTDEKFKFAKNVFEPVDIAKITDKIIADEKSHIREKDIKLIYYKDKKLKNVLGNKEALTHILANLFSNAIIYTSKGGEVKIFITYDKKDKRINWLVEDTGIGIPEKNQNSVFEKFKRGKNANTMNCDGSGLGLFIAKKLIEAHKGGKIDFCSKEGKWSKFWISLPEG